MSNDNRRIGLVLGLLSALGPFAIDMYLPGLPALGQALGANAAAVQFSLVVYLIASSILQLVFGPLSDVFGRKTPMIFGLALFAAASAGCALAGSIDALIVFRALQGVGACAGMVIPRAVVRDLHTGREAVSLMASLMLVFAISPILAPLFGSFVVAALGWRAVFWIIGAAALLGLLLTVLGLPETRPAEARRGSSLGKSIADYKLLFMDPHFLGLGAICGFAMAAFLVYLANSSFVLIGHYRLSPTQYSLLFSLNAIAFIGAAQINSLLVSRFPLVSLIRTAAAGFVAAMVALLALTVSGVESLPVMATLLFMGFACMGLILPNATVLALDQHGAIAGTASALFGALQMVIASAMMAAASYFANGNPAPMIAGIAASALCALAATFIFLRSPPRQLSAG